MALATATTSSNEGANVARGSQTDGFHLLIDALKLNGVETIYNVPGIPITDLGRYAQAQGMRVLSFRHEQHAGYAAAAAGFLTKKPGVCMTVSAPGFLNGLTAVAHATTNCWPMIMISGSSDVRSSICSVAIMKRWTNWRLRVRTVKPLIGSCMPKTLGWALPAQFARR